MKPHPTEVGRVRDLTHRRWVLLGRSGACEHAPYGAFVHKGLLPTAGGGEAPAVKPKVCLRQNEGGRRLPGVPPGTIVGGVS